MRSIALQESEAREKVRHLFFHEDYWVIPIVSDGALEMAQSIEQRYYKDVPEDDFQVYIISIPMSTALAFAHKRHMSVGECEMLFQDIGIESEVVGVANDGAEHDILWCIPDSFLGLLFTSAYVTQLAQWLDPEGEFS